VVTEILCLCAKRFCASDFPGRNIKVVSLGQGVWSPDSWGGIVLSAKSNLFHFPVRAPFTRPFTNPLTTSTTDIMGRMSVLVGFWIAGYALGYFAWTVKEPILQFIEHYGLSADAAGGFVMGLMGSAVMVIGIIFWSFFSSS
jgi:hypothetical protein